MTSIAIPVSKSSAVPSNNLITLVNLALIASCAALLFYYVLSANGLASANYSISSLHEKLTKASDAQTQLTAQASDLENTDAIKAYAAGHGMVSAKDSSYIFENGNVALVR